MTVKPLNTELTANEIKVLRALATNNFGSADDCGGQTWASCINDAREPSGIEGKALSGVVSSLSKKGWIYCENDNRDSVIGWQSEKAYDSASLLRTL